MGDWEEVGPAGQSAQQQLMSAPPRVAAAPLGQANYRPPVEPPVDASRNGAVQMAAAVRETFYVVQAGDTLPKIAMKVFGDPNRWQDLMVLNNIDNGNRIYVGQKLATAANNAVAAPVAQNFAAAAAPAARQVTAKAAGAVNNSIRQPVAHVSPSDFEVPDHEIEETEAPSVSADAAEADASYYGQTGGSYTVQRGDTLGKIAKRVLGSSQKWREIARANPSINPNRLNVGDTLVIPGAAPAGFEMSAPTVESRPLSSQPWQAAMAAPSGLNQAPPAVSAPSFDPPPLMAPPQGGYAPYNTAPAAMDSYAPPPAPPVYGGMTPPPPPVGMPGAMEPPSSPYLGGPVPGPSAAPNQPVAIGTRELYREERYRIPDELKPTDFTPYFTNRNGYHGLFGVESAFLPYIPTWNFGLQLRYEKYQYLNGEKNIIEGTETYTPIHLTWAGKKMFAGVTVPFQSWEVKRSGVGTSVSLSGMHDPSVKLGYQVWKNFEGDHAVTLHAEGKFPGGNYHQPLVTMTGKSTTGVRVGPAESTRGAWVEVGGAYSGQMNEQWASHLNLALANDSEDSITKFILRAGTDYRVNRNFSIVGELNSTSYEMDGGPDNTNVDLVLGFLLFNDSWQGSLGFPIALQKGWGYSHDFGVEFGLNHRWD
jgi:nucleoid-associated protein YgaU